MPRKPRIEKVGFYHVVNRGVAGTNIYLSGEDYLQFLEIVQDASDEYSFEIYSFCLMNNHYHLLLKTYDKNLSAAMQKINSRYSIYFNNKYKRVGPLWQGRFKSWFVYDEVYLHTLVRYIEFNPIKANITQNIGQYTWAMSSNNVLLPMLHFDIIQKIDFTNLMSEEEQRKLDVFLNTKLDIKEDEVIQKEKHKIESYFGLRVDFLDNTKSKNLIHTRENATYKAISDGYTQKEVGNYLGLSHVAISKMLKNYKQKIKLFKKLRDKGIFWSYSKNVSYEDIGSGLFVEYLLKYGDFDDIKLGFELFGKRYMKKIWEEKLKSDKGFIKTNLMLARVFFDMDVESNYFKEVKNERFEKLKLLAS
jgi:REP element-mobilizing transposase RayT